MTSSFARFRFGTRALVSNASYLEDMAIRVLNCAREFAVNTAPLLIGSLRCLLEKRGAQLILFPPSANPFAAPELRAHHFAFQGDSHESFVPLRLTPHRS